MPIEGRSGNDDVERGALTTDEQYERLKHRAMFLFERGLTSRAMHDANSQLLLLERLAGKDPSKLDSHVRDRLHHQLEDATLKQLTETGLFDEWQTAWDVRQTPPSVADPQSPHDARLERAVRIRA